MATEEETGKMLKLSQQFAYASIQMHEAIGRKAGMSGTDHKYLGFLLQRGQMTAGELAKMTGLTTGAVTSLIDRCEKKKLVKRHPDKFDRRKIIIVPDIKKITKLLIPLYEDFRNNTEEMFAAFSSEDLQVLERYFSKAIEIANRKIESINQKNKE